MADLLDLRSEDRPTRARRYRRRRWIAVIVVFALLIALVFGAVVGVRRLLASFGTDTADYKGEGTGSVVVRVHTGDTATDIAGSLHDDGVVASVAAFRSAASQDSRSRGVQAGYFRLRSRMSAAAAVALLLDPAARVRSKVTLPEGLPLADALSKIAASTEVPLADLQAAAGKPADLGLPDYAKGQLEGFLFPATYDIEPGSSATNVLRQMVERSSTSAASLNLVSRAAAIARTPYDVLITASLIEKETAVPADRPKVARVVYNRLAIDMPLQFDSSVNYLRAEKKARLSVDDLKVESDYNTYTHKGLPPTPIGSPGEATIEAALSPADGDWLYFVTTSKDGSALFTKSFKEFTAAAVKARADGVY